MIDMESLPVSTADAVGVATPAGIDFTSSTLTGIVRNVRSWADGFTLLTIEPTGSPQASRTVLGEFDDNELSMGVAYRFFGTWVDHPKYGAQFSCDSYVLDEQTTAGGVIAYLSRSSFGINARQAERLWKTFGRKAIATLRERPDDVIAEGILPPDEAYAASTLLREATEDEPTKIALFELFAKRGFPRGVIAACIRLWRSRAPAVIRKDAFKLMIEDIPGCGFKRCDKLFIDLGGNPARLKRQMLAGWHWLRTNGSGNTWEFMGGFNAAVLLATGDVTDSKLEKALKLGVRSKWLSTRIDNYGTWVAERKKATDEIILARKIREMTCRENH